MWAASYGIGRRRGLARRTTRPRDRPAPRRHRRTLLIFSGRDERLIEWNRQALAALRAPKELAIVPGATHLFEEAGALDDVAELGSSGSPAPARRPAR